MFPKLSRVESQANLDLMRTYVCSVCCTAPVDVHHVRTKGAGGGDELTNIVSLCRGHHQAFHSMGVKSFKAKYGQAITFFRQRKRLPELIW